MKASHMVPVVKKCILILACLGYTIVHAQEMIFPNSANWREVSEGSTLAFTLKTTDSIMPYFSLEGANELKVSFDSVGNFF